MHVTSPPSPPPPPISLHSWSCVLFILMTNVCIMFHMKLQSVWPDHALNKPNNNKYVCVSVCVCGKWQVAIGHWPPSPAPLLAGLFCLCGGYVSLTADYTIHLALQVCSKYMHVCLCECVCVWLCVTVSCVGHIANFYIKIYYMRASRCWVEPSSMRKVKFVVRVTNFNWDAHDNNNSNNDDNNKTLSITTPCWRWQDTTTLTSPAWQTCPGDKLVELIIQKWLTVFVYS